MNQANYITHVELENPNLQPEISVYLYATTKYTSGSDKTALQTNFDSNYATWYNKSSIDLNLWDNTLDRFDITPFAINIGSIDYRTNDEFMSSDTLSSSTTLVLLKRIDDLYPVGLTNEQKGFHFDTIQPQDEEFDYGNSDKINAFNIAGYTQDGMYADIEVRLTIRDQDGTDLGKVSGGTVLFRGLVNSIQNGRNEVTLNILDGLIQARTRGNTVGEIMRSEISSYKERFYGGDTDFQYDLDEVHDMSNVKENRTYNLKHFPVIPPLRDSEEKVVKLKIQRNSPINFYYRDRLSTPFHEIYHAETFEPDKIYSNYNFTEGTQVEKILDKESLSWKKFEVDWQTGVLKFELPPVVEPEGSLFIDEYKVAYKHKHPSFLAEELFKELGYEGVSFSRENLSPHYPSDGDPFSYEWKIPSKRGVVNKTKDGRNFGATAIQYCEYDKLYYYFSKGGIYKTDFETINEKICSTDVIERFLDSNNDWKKVSNTTKGDDVRELDVNQIALIRPINKPTALRIIATVNRDIEFEEDNPYDIPYSRSRVGLDTTGGGGIVKNVGDRDYKYPDRDKQFDWNYDYVDGSDSIPGQTNYLTGSSQDKFKIGHDRITWGITGRSTGNYDTSSFNRWRKDTICTLYYFDIEGFFDNSGDVNTYYYHHSSHIYSRDNAGVVTKLFKIDHDVDKIEFFSSKTIGSTNYPNVLQIDYTTIASKEPSKARAFYYLNSGVWTHITTNFKYPTNKQSSSDSILFPQKSEPTKLHNLSYDNNSDSTGDEMLPVDPLHHDIVMTNYGTTTNSSINGVSENPKYYFDHRTGGTSDIKYIGWGEKTYENTDLFYANKHTLLYGDKLTNNFAIIEDSTNNKQILVALEIASDESIVGMRKDNGEGTIHGYSTNEPGGLSKSLHKDRHYEKAIYLCFYDISQSTLKEINKQRIGVPHPRGNQIDNNDNKGYQGGEDYLPLDYIGYALQRFNRDCKIKDSFIGADILYEKEGSDHLIYILLNDTIMKFRWEPDSSKIEISSQIDEMPNYSEQTTANGVGSVEAELKNSMSIVPFGKDNTTNSDFIRFKDWRTDNLMFRIPNYNNVVIRDSNSPGGRDDARGAVFIDSRYIYDYLNRRYLNDDLYNNNNSSSYNRETNSEEDENNYKSDPDGYMAHYRTSFIAGRVQHRYRNDIWHKPPNRDSVYRLKGFTFYDAFMSSHELYGHKNNLYVDSSKIPFQFTKEQYWHSYDLGLRSYQYLLFGQMKKNTYRVSQVYGLTKMKGKRVFSFYTVNRECFSKQTQRRTRYDLDGKREQYRNQDDKRFEHNIEGMMAYQYVIDFDEITYQDDIAPNLRLSTEVYPTALHQQYYDVLNEITLELQNAREEAITDNMLMKENGAMMQFLPHGREKTQNDTTLSQFIRKDLRGDKTTWAGDVWMAITKTNNNNLYTSSGDEFKRLFTPYKSKYFAYSCWTENRWDISNATGRLHQKWKQSFYNTITRWNGGDEIPIDKVNGWEENLKGSYQRLLGMSRFWSFMNARRREHASYNILPSLLPKTSSQIGTEMIHLIGNYGEYITSDKMVGLADVWESSHPELKRLLSHVNNWNEQDTHGTVSITTANFDYPTESGGSRRYNSKNLGFMYLNDTEDIYKDFLCKPLIVSETVSLAGQYNMDKEDIHFVVGRSVGNRKLVRETVLARSGKHATIDSEYGRNSAIQQAKWSEPLRSSRLYDNENCMWITLSNDIIPTIPNGDFSGSTIYESLKMLATVMDYNFGIEDNVPFFKPKEDFFYLTGNFASVGSYDYIESEYFKDKELNAYYYMSGEVIFVKSSPENDMSNTAVDGWYEVVRKVGVGNGSTVYPKETVSDIKNNLTIGSGESTRIYQAGYRQLYKIKMVVDENNIIDITQLNTPYQSNYTDIHLSYGDKVHKRKIKNSNAQTKKIFSKSLPLIEDLNWVKFLSRKLQKEISYDRTMVSIVTKINPSLRGNDYIAIFFNNSEISIGTIDNTSITSPATNLGNVYELYKIKSVSHNLEGFTSTITAESVETSSLDTLPGALINV